MSKKPFFICLSSFTAFMITIFASQAAAQTTISISSYEELIKIGTQSGYPMNGSYKLTQNITIPSDLGAKGFTPIGEYGKDDNNAARQFTGIFDGNGKTISGLHINRPNDNYIGLFGYIGSNATIKDLYIQADSIVGKNYVGVVAGYANSVKFSSCSITGVVKGTVYVGGVIGYAYYGGYIEYSNYKGTVSGDTLVGGLAGYTYNYSISQSSFDGIVNGTFKVGGAVGEMNGSVRKLHTLGTINGNVNVGGICGWYYGYKVSFDLSYSAASVKGDTAVGGLIGATDGMSTIYDVDSSYFTGDVSGVHSVGGLVGQNNGGYIRNCYTTGSVIGNVKPNGSNYYFGGLVGYNKRGSIEASYAIGPVSVSKGYYVGGLVGRNDSASISQSYTAGTVETQSNTNYVGGLVGYNSYGTITDCYSVSNVNGYNYVGGFIGYSAYSRTKNGYFIGVASKDTTSTSSNFGSLIGYSLGTDSVLACYWDTVAVGMSKAVGYQSASSYFSNVIGKDFNSMTTSLDYSSAWNFTTVWDVVGNEHYPYLRAHRTQLLKYSAGQNGSIKGSTRQTINIGAGQTVTAVPASGYFFVLWNDGLKTAARADHFVTSDSISFVAKFGLKYKLTYGTQGSGFLIGDTAQIVLETEDGATVTAVANGGYVFTGWSDNVKTPQRTDRNVSENKSVYAIFVQSDAVMANDRVIPNGKTGEQSIVIPTHLIAAVTVGPNPIAKRGKASIFYQGKAISGGTLIVFDAFGNVVKKIKIDGKQACAEKSKIGSWNMSSDIAEGAYLLKGELVAKDGSKIKVSTVIGVR